MIGLYALGVRPAVYIGVWLIVHHIRPWFGPLPAIQTESLPSIFQTDPPFVAAVLEPSGTLQVQDLVSAATSQSMKNSLLSFSRYFSPLFWSLFGICFPKWSFPISGLGGGGRGLPGGGPAAWRFETQWIRQWYEAWKMPREYLYHVISCIMYNIYIIYVYIRYIYSPVESFQEESYHVISFVVRPVELCQLNNPNCNTWWKIQTFW